MKVNARPEHSGQSSVPEGPPARLGLATRDLPARIGLDCHPQDAAEGEVTIHAQTWRLVKPVDADTGADLASLNSPDPQQITAWAFSADGSQLLVGTGADGAVLTWRGG